MDLHIDRDELSRGLARIQGVIERRSTHPLLSHVLLHARHSSGAGSLKMTATDTEVAFIGDLEAKIEGEGQIAVDASRLFQIIRAMPEPTVQLTMGNGNRLEIRSGRSFFRLPGHSAEEYPPLPAFDQSSTVQMTEGTILRFVEQTSFAVATDDGGMYGLNGAYLQRIEDEKGIRLRMVATDGHRLSAAEGTFEGELTLTPRTLVPRKALAVIRKLLDGKEDKIEVSFGEGAIRLSLPNQVFWFRLLDAEFPDYNAVLPKECKHRATLNRAELSAALKRIMILVADRTQAVRFSFEQEDIEIEVRNVDHGEVKESVSMTYEGESIGVGFNARYLQDILNAMKGDKVVLELAHPLSPCMVRDPDDESAFFVVMPMRLD